MSSAYNTGAIVLIRVIHIYIFIYIFVYIYKYVYIYVYIYIYTEIRVIHVRGVQGGEDPYDVLSS